MPLHKSSRWPWEQYPLALECPNCKGRNGERKCTKTYRVHLIGYLGKNPEHKSVRASDRKYAVLSLATQRSWKGADEEWHSKTEWHRIVAWNGVGEYAAAKLSKGDHIYVEGTLVSGTFEKEFGKGKSKVTVPLKTWQVKADSIRKLNRVRKDQAANNVPPDAQPEEIPF